MLDMPLTVLDLHEAPAEPITIDPDYWDAYGRELIANVIIQAVRDARRGDLGAVEWLQWDGLAWCEAVGFDAEQIISQWIAAGCPDPEPSSKAHTPTGTRKPAKKRKSSQGAPGRAQRVQTMPT